MTTVTLVCSKDGLFKSCKAEGHAGFARKGKDLVCAAETMLLRTAMEILEETKGVVLNAQKASRGNLAFGVEALSQEVNAERLRCTADFIRTGIRDLQDEYPQFVQLREITED